MNDLTQLLNDIYRRADSLSVFALRAVSADLNPVNREKMRLECKVLLAELHDLHQALDAMEVQP
ncbi:hypothetical protein [Thiothrix lacustris]|uniref:hypothetical protein n=1 Tax=Thiothrix lacustris TaxID=525917 RepID=UPI000490D281|nr:hypothetical protein [Thiothrix lacustris]